MKRPLAAAVLAFVGAAVPAPMARASDYPVHAIKLVLPQPPGGAIDLIARSLGERLSEQLKQPVIVENRPGANGGLAAADVARSAADGYTLFMAVDTNLVVNPTLYRDLAYDPFRDFAPISILTRSELVLVASPEMPANKVRELIAYAKAHPGQLNYSSIGLGYAVQADDQDEYRSGGIWRDCRGHDRCGRRSCRRHDHRPALGEGHVGGRQAQIAGRDRHQAPSTMHADTDKWAAVIRATGAKIQ